MGRISLSTATVLVAIAILTLQAAAQSPAKKTEHDAKIIAAVRAVIEAQREAWNHGDIEAYMDGYARSDETVFVSGDNVMRGWQSVLDRYKRNYNSREKMGALTFSSITESTGSP